MPPLLADFTHARPCKPFCEKYLTLPKNAKYELDFFVEGEFVHGKKENYGATTVEQ